MSAIRAGRRPRAAAGPGGGSIERLPAAAWGVRVVSGYRLCRIRRPGHVQRDFRGCPAAKFVPDHAR
jgi:hypothetical protein